MEHIMNIDAGAAPAGWPLEELEMSGKSSIPADVTGPPGGPRSRAALAALRHAIRGIEGRHVEADKAAALMRFGIAEIDAALGGGLPRPALHEIAAASESEIAAASAFALVLAGRSAQSRA